MWMTAIIYRFADFSVPDVHYKYYMVVSPLDGRLYITDQQNLRIIRVKTMGAVRELTQNFEVVAGNGEQCVPGAADQCGDGKSAVDARLFYPKGMRDSFLLLSMSLLFVEHTPTVSIVYAFCFNFQNC